MKIGRGGFKVVLSMWEMDWIEVGFLKFYVSLNLVLIFYTTDKSLFVKIISLK